ncbi:MAG: hypothetical protein C0421_01700 [Hyphomonas sp.]|nr:hypothetical protein [Hyphomonas sp.]
MRKWTDFAGLRARFRDEGFGLPDVTVELFSSICDRSFTVEEYWQEHDALALEYLAMRYWPRPLSEEQFRPRTLYRQARQKITDWHRLHPNADWRYFYQFETAQKMRELHLLPPNLGYPLVKKSDVRSYGLDIGRSYGFQRSKFEPKERWFEKVMNNSGVIGAYRFDVGGLHAGPPTSFRIEFCLRLQGHDTWRTSFDMIKFFGALHGYQYLGFPSVLPFPPAYTRPSDEAVSNLVKLGVLANVSAFDLLLQELDAVDL